MSEDGLTTVVAEPVVRKAPQHKRDQKRKKQPRYNVILWDDNDHSYEYVINMMRQIFGYPYAKGVQIAKMVDSLGRCICLTTTREHAELKRDQILSYGKDALIDRCKGSMTATIEAVE
jgi:ATP-dependent Clp protease adaptor protein ClpS